ncbi:hypothetical protein B296_00043931 [Ensete ventricosum]|uniref:Uncharacterized protein n=1 Tax=Ensete ventricosum TaxID=4639 RepID=A0A426XMD4_ENSVE|nr:hypothetical protein B296_00043931 [Ensete ventricosum]
MKLSDDREMRSPYDAMVRSVDDRFPISFYFSIVNKFLKQIPQDSIKEIEKSKPFLGMNNDASGEKLGRRCKQNMDGLRSPSQRWTKKILNFSSFKERKVLIFLHV